MATTTNVPILPLYTRDIQEREISKKKSWFADYSEPVFAITGVTGIVGTVVNVAQAETFDIIIGGTCSIASLIAYWRVRKLHINKSILDNVNNLTEQNQELEETTNDLQEENDQLQATSKKLTIDIKKLHQLTGIIDTNNKTAEEIQNELTVLIDRYNRENEKYNKLNKGHAFLIADQNHDGKLDKQEKELLQTITIEDIENIDKNQDNIITKEEYLKK